MDLDKEQVEHLLMLGLIGQFVINGSADEKSYEPKYDQVLDLLLDRAKDMGLEKLIQDSPDGPVPSPELFGKMNNYIERFFTSALEELDEDGEEFALNDLEEMLGFEPTKN